MSRSATERPSSPSRANSTSTTPRTCAPRCSRRAPRSRPCSFSTSQTSPSSTPPPSAYSSRRARARRPRHFPPRRAGTRNPPGARGLRSRQALLRPRHGRRGACLMPTEGLLPSESLARYADAIVKASLVIGKGDTLYVQGEPEHRELLVPWPARPTGQERNSSTSSPPTRSSTGLGSSTRTTTRSERCRRGTDACCARCPAPTARSPRSPARERPATSTASSRNGLAPTMPAVRSRRPSSSAPSSTTAPAGRRRLADELLGEPGLSQARPAEGEAQARERSPRVLPADRRRREGHEWVAEARARAAPPVDEADETRPHRTRAPRAWHVARRRPHSRNGLPRRRRHSRGRSPIHGEHPDRRELHEPERRGDQRYLPLHVPALIPRPAHRGTARRVRRRAACPARR